MSPTPALVTQRGARRLPRVALLLLSAAYVLPGLFDRDPWRNADLVAFAQMLAIAEGHTPWLAPMLGGVPGDTALLPHWLGAVFIMALSPFIDSDFAARIPFGLLLALSMAAVWYTTFHLARTDAAQPAPFAFGGEADPVDYARAIADGALLALIATLGLLQLGHETTPELAQLFGVSLLLWSIASAPFRHWRPRVGVLLAVALLSGSGAPAMGLAMGLGGLVVCWRSSYAAVRRFVPWLAAAIALGVAVASALGAWRLRAVLPDSGADLVSIARQWAWFLWPAWLLVLWTLWRWRRHLANRHIALPLVSVGVSLAANLLMNGADRALMLALPGMAVLAAFALPTFKRSNAAAVDWFSMFFFTGAAITIWVVYTSMMTGVPAKPAANVARLAPGFVPLFQPVELAFALAGTVAWLWLVRWRTGRHREAVWKSMALPAGGVALNWLLLMTLWLPLLDYGRSSRPLVERVAQHVPKGATLAAPGLSPVQVAAMEVFGGWRVDARPGSDLDRANTHLLRVVSLRQPLEAPPGWVALGRAQGPRDRDDAIAVYRRQAETGAP